MKARRRIAAPLALALAVSITACAPALPETVVPGSAVTVGWTGTLTSANAAAAPTPGNLDVAALTRAGFGEVVDGEFVADEGFGAVGIVAEEPFTVRYDLAEPVWSDGIPLDAADLLLGWAAASGLLPTGEPDTADAAPEVPRIDEFARAIEVSFTEPRDDWQQAVTVPVPAHVVAAAALEIEDPMEAKQALIRAISDADAEALAAIAEAWNEGFAVPEAGELNAAATVSSGPFRVDAVATDAEGQSVTLVPNAAYRGTVTPRIAQIDLVPAGADPASEIGARLDVAQPAPVAATRAPVDALERKDFAVSTTHDGAVWALLLRPAGVFSAPAARAAFLRAIPADEVLQRGAGEWAPAYTASTAMLSAPGSRPYDIATEDSGFAAALTGADDPALERAAAGIAPGTPVCVVYDRASEFAAGAFAAVRDAASAAGWSVGDCAADDVAGTLAAGGWEAALVRVTIPQTAAAVAAQWGSAGSVSLVGLADPEVDALIAELGRTTDVYAARDRRAQVEAAIIRQAVALPIAVNPTVTIVDKDVTGVAARTGSRAALTADAEQWEAAP